MDSEAAILFSDRRAGDRDVYYVRRDGRIKGPLTREKLRTLRQERRLRMRDDVAESVDGP